MSLRRTFLNDEQQGFWRDDGKYQKHVMKPNFKNGYLEKR